MAPRSPPQPTRQPAQPIPWKFFNSYASAKDLEDYDDFLSHVLLDSVGTKTPFGVHHMRQRGRFPAHDASGVLNIIRKRILRKRDRDGRESCIKATNAFLELPFVRKFLKGKSQEKIDAFATHAYRYFTLYIPYGTVEIAHTSRYTFRTHKSELCVLALAPITAGSYITQLEGTMARLTADEDAALSMSKNNGYEGRKDFSVVQLAGSNQNMMFLGPARFVNHDCQPNAMLERKDKVMRFKALKNINAAEEITAYYADDYFGSGNRECLCKTCEDLGRGGWASLKSITTPQSGGHNSSESSGTKRRQLSDRSLQIDTDSEDMSAAHAGSGEEDHSPSAKRKGRNAAQLISSDDDDDAPKAESSKDGARSARSQARGPQGKFKRKESQPSTPIKEEPSSSRLIRSAPRRVTADSPTPISAPSTVSRGLSFTGLKNALANLVFSGAADKSVPSVSEESSVRAGKRKRESTPEPSPSSRRAADATLSTSRASKRRSQAPQSSAGSDGDESGGDDGSDESDDEDDAPRRVLRPRLTQTASSSTSQAPQSNHISPTAPHIRSLNALKLQTQRKKPQWKGWISLPNGSCDNCYGIHEELKDCEPEPDQLLICQRCTRHFNVYGEKWPGRNKEVFTDLSSTSSDDESSDSDGSSSGESEQAVTFRSSRLLKRALAEKAKAKAEGRAITLSVATASTRQAMLDDRARKANARKRAKAAALEQSRSISASEDNSRQSPSPAPPSKVAAPRKSAVVAVSSLTKTKEKITISKGRVSVASTTVTVSAAAATIRGRKSVGGTSASGTPGKSGGRENTRAMRAEARRIARDNPDLDIEDAKRAAAAGVMRSGRTRGVEKEEKMPVTGPPIATISKRKRAASTSEEDEDTKKRPRGRPRKHPYADDDDEDGEEDEDEEQDAIADVTARSTGKASATSTPTVRLTVKRNGKPLYGAAKASAAKKAAMAALAATSTPESKKPKLEFTTRSGGRWGAQSPDRSSSPAGSHSSARSSRSDTRGAEEDADGEDDNEKDGGSPSTRRAQLFSLKPNPAFFALKKQVLSEQAAPEQLRYPLIEDGTSTGSTPAPPTVVEEGSSPVGRPQLDDVFTSDASTDSAKLVQAQLESGLAEDGEEVVQLEITQITTDSSTFTLTIDPAEVETTVTASGSESPNSRDTPLGTSVPPSISSASTAPSSKSAGTPKLLEDALTSATSPVMSLAARANSNPRTYQTSLSARKRDGF